MDPSGIDTGGMNTRGGNAGGGEILKYWGQQAEENQWLDTNLIRQFIMLPWVRVIIVALLVFAMILIIIKLMQVRNPLKGKAITNELEYLDKVKKRDERILKMNRSINLMTKLIEKSPFSINKSVIDYWSYNLTRANIRTPGGTRILKPEEFHAAIVCCEAVVIGAAVLIGIFFSAPICIMLIIGTIFIGNTVPMTYVRQLVKAKDMEITAHFADFYLMIHYVLLASAGTPISGIIKSFDKTTTSEEMHRFADVCIHYIDTYGEYEATRYISKTYREITEVGKLMRLIRQANEGGDVRAELMGFRNELMTAKKYAITKRMEKIVMQARASFNILYIVLFQAIVSAMAIYIDDLSMGVSLF